MLFISCARHGFRDISMKKMLFFVLTAIVIMACSPIEPDRPHTGGGSSNGTTKQPPVANFSYTIEHPLTVVLRNNSQNATSYKWDFGDGNTSTEKNPKHKYKTKGVYRIKLIVYGNGTSDQEEINVTIIEPTKIYFKGVRYEKLAVNNEYIKFKLTDDDPLFTDTWCNSVYELISTANLPYNFTLKNPIILDDSTVDWYKLTLYWSKKNSGNGTEFFYTKFMMNQIYSEYPTELICQDSKNRIVILFEYK